MAAEPTHLTRATPIGEQTYVATPDIIYASPA
jgi:hypothetical protein